MGAYSREGRFKRLLNNFVKLKRTKSNAYKITIVSKIGQSMIILEVGAYSRINSIHKNLTCGSKESTLKS